MPQATCTSCLKPADTVSCGICSEPVCRRCREFLDESAFSFRSSLAPELKKTYYCPGCHDGIVAPAKEEYESLMEEAKEVFIFFTTQRQPLPVLRKAPRAVVIEDCPDRDEAILRMAFQAAEQGFNSVIEVEVSAKKVRNHAWQKSSWSGRGLPAQLDSERLKRFS